MVSQRLAEPPDRPNSEYFTRRSRFVRSSADLQYKVTKGFSEKGISRLLASPPVTAP
jgi:hypothetical protein